MAIIKNSPPIITSGLVFNIDFANTRSFPNRTGTNLYDLSGNNYSGSLVNGPTYSLEGGGSLYFDGGNDYVSTSYMQPIYNTTTSFTWNLWTNPGNIAVNTAVGIIGSRGQDLNFTKLTKTNFQYYPDQINYSMTSFVWQNICIVKNQTSLTYYRDGTVVGTTTALTVKPSPKLFYIGTDPAEQPGTNSVSSVQVYDRALTLVEVLQNYNAQKSRYNLK
jgi:hypothetical protein